MPILGGEAAEDVQSAKFYRLRRSRPVWVAIGKIMPTQQMTPQDPDPTAKRIADAVVRARKAQGLDQETLALVSDVSVRTVGKIERAHESVRLDLLLRVLRAVGLDLTLKEPVQP